MFLMLLYASSFGKTIDNLVELLIDNLLIESIVWIPRQPSQMAIVWVHSKWKSIIGDSQLFYR